ncbi:MAG TPA: hypothetical protein VGE67_06555 [Haloferula sp.]
MNAQIDESHSLARMRVDPLRDMANQPLADLVEMGVSRFMHEAKGCAL